MQSRALAMKHDRGDAIRVLHVMRTYGKHGGEQQLSQLFGANDRQDIEEIFSFVVSDPECAQLFSRRAPRLIQFDLWPKPHATGSAWQEFAYLIPRLPVLQWRYIRLIARLKPNACIVHGFQAALVAWPAACWFRTVGHAYMHRITKSTRRFGSLFRILYWPFSVVAGNSNAVMRSLAPYTESRKLLALDNGINLKEFDEKCRVSADGSSAKEDRSKSQDQVLISVGRLLPYKGQDLLIDAIAMLLAVHPSLRLWIVGDGVFKEVLEQKVRAMGLQDHVAFLGHRTDVPALLARSSIFVNASSWEGMSNAVLEGMAASLPSVVADAPGVSECHVDGVTGLVVAREPQALAQAIATLLDDPERARQMGQAARQRLVETYSIAANRQRFNALYEKLKG